MLCAPGLFIPIAIRKQASGNVEANSFKKIRSLATLGLRFAQVKWHARDRTSSGKEVLPYCSILGG
jgi:hypothetical protein